MSYVYWLLIWYALGVVASFAVSYYEWHGGADVDLLDVIYCVAFSIGGGVLLVMVVHQLLKESTTWYPPKPSNVVLIKGRVAAARTL